MKKKMNDYTDQIGFWNRLESFVKDIETNCCMGSEEKQMILNICKSKKENITKKCNCPFIGNMAECNNCDLNK